MIVERSFDDAAQMAEVLADDIARCLRNAVDARGAASFVVTGGTTPAPLYRKLAHCDVPWAHITVTLSDERWVEPNHAASNEAMVRSTLFAGAAKAAAFIALKTPVANPNDAVTGVDIALRAAPRPVDVSLLGLGADGHIASLFSSACGYSGAMTATGNDPLVHAIHAPQAAGAPDRMTLTLAALLASRLIVVMFTGAAKLAAYRAAKAGEGDSPLKALLARSAAPVWVCWSLEGAP